MIEPLAAKQASASAACRPSAQYHGTPTALRSYYNNINTQRHILIRKPHPLSRVETWTLPNMDRKPAQKPAPPTTTLPSSGRDALKYKTLSNQKSSTKSDLHTPPGKRSQAGKEILLQQSTSKVVQLFSKTLPAVPHILSSGREQRDDKFSPDEIPHPLFKREEFGALQYMTLMDCAERETLEIMPGWELEEKSISPASGGDKSSRTPNGEGDRKRPKKKIKFGDYARVGKMVTTQADTVTAVVHQLPPKPSIAKDTRGAMIATKGDSVKVAAEDAKNESGRQGDAVSAAKTGGHEPKGKSAPVQSQAKSHFAAVITSEKHSEAHGDSVFPEGLKPTKRPVPTNPNPQTPATNTQSKASSNGMGRAAQIPPNSSSSNANLKRSLAENEAFPPAKKVKVSPNSVKRPLVEDDESSPPATKKARLSNGVHIKDSKQLSQISHPSTKKENTSSQSESSSKKSTTTKPSVLDQSKPTTTPRSTFTKIPPLLSPTLPPQVYAANGTGETLKSTAGRSSSNHTASKTPKSNPDGSDMMDLRGGHFKPHPGIPRLLSPSLPSIVEAARAARDAARAAKDPSSSEKQIDTPKRATDTVADRHETSRQPNAPGVAKKVSKNSKSQQENSNTPTNGIGSISHTVETSKEQIPILKVKLKYKKKHKKDIERILKLRPNPAANDNEIISRTESNVSKAGDRALGRNERRNSQDRPRPMERDVPSKRPVPSASVAQKRPRPEEPQQVNNKRLKPSDHPLSSKPSTPSTPAFKSPAVSVPSSAQRVTTGTPKKSDVLKGAATMASVNPTDGNARTPQFSQASVPGSAEHSAAPARNGGSTDQRLSSIAIVLKREMDRLHQLKQSGLDSVSLADRTHGLVVGLECSLAYMSRFEATDNSYANRHNAAKNWTELWALHRHIDHAVKDIPILDVLSIQIKILIIHRMTNAYASISFQGVDLAALSQNIISQQQLWRELDHKMSDEAVQTIEESTSKTKKGFNPGASFKHFLATSLRKLRRYADIKGVSWDQKLHLDN